MPRARQDKAPSFGNTSNQPKPSGNTSKQPKPPSTTTTKGSYKSGKKGY